MADSGSGGEHTRVERWRRRRLGVPTGWRVVRTSGLGPFVTRAVLQRPDGSEVEWTSRGHRKRLILQPVTVESVTPVATGRPGPSAMSWAIGALFGIGSVCFALGSVPAYFNHVAPRVVGLTFFVGSICFTSAAYLQYREVVAAPDGVEAGASSPSGLRSYLGFAPHRIDWWATTVQLVGTVFFNVTTFAATRPDLTLQQEKRLIWAPDVFGSICFLIASWMAWTEVSKRGSVLRGRSVGWWISGLNLVGSVAFGVSAVSSRYVSTTGVPANIALVNLGTLVGAVCFLAGAALLPVESAREG